MHGPKMKICKIHQKQIIVKSHGESGHHGKNAHGGKKQEQSQLTRHQYTGEPPPYCKVKI